MFHDFQLSDRQVSADVISASNRARESVAPANLGHIVPTVPGEGHFPYVLQVEIGYWKEEMGNWKDGWADDWYSWRRGGTFLKGY